MDSLTRSLLKTVAAKTPFHEQIKEFKIDNQNSGYRVIVMYMADYDRAGWISQSDVLLSHAEMSDAIVVKKFLRHIQKNLKEDDGGMWETRYPGAVNKALEEMETVPA